MTAAEIKAECERIWREHDCSQPWHVTRWEITWLSVGVSLAGLRGKRYNLRRKSKYLGYGPNYLTKEGYARAYRHKLRAYSNV